MVLPSISSTMNEEEVLIVGGGLAGMSAALRLLERGVRVTLVERSHRLGGKAGAEQHGPDWDEHGWHLFPLWYRNIWQLVDELGIGSSFVDRERYAFMRPGAYPNVAYLENPFALSSAFRNLFNGILPPAETFLYHYVMIDLMSQPERVRARLDQMSVNGFARSRFYCTDAVVDQLEDTVSRASAIESYEMSAMTVHNVMRYWLMYHEPWFRVLRGDLQSLFIAPIERRLRDLGCEIRTLTTVERIDMGDGRIASVTTRATGSPATSTLPIDNLIMAVPLEDLRPLVTAPIQATAPKLGGLFYLRSRVMAGMTVYLKRRIEGVPGDHVNFIDPAFDLSMIDVTELWGRTKTVLCVVASDYTPLQTHEAGDGQRILIDELRRYLPFLKDDEIERVDFQPHADHPLFATTAGACPRRPQAQTEIENLFVAGDYCQSTVDLTCMEGAVSTGLRAAEAVRLGHRP